MQSAIFYSDIYKRIEQQTLELLNSQEEFLSSNTLNSTRAAGDAIQEILSESFYSVLGEWCVEYSTGFAQRAMADLHSRT